MVERWLGACLCAYQIVVVVERWLGVYLCAYLYEWECVFVHIASFFFSVPHLYMRERFSGHLH